MHILILIGGGKSSKWKLECNIHGASAKTWHYKKMLIEQSWYLESGHLYSYFNESCLLTKTTLKKETF